jgi:hypothetical protein
MQDLEEVAPAFVAMAHNIVWASVATVDGHGRPRSRILHPYWEWDGESLVGWIATVPTRIKQSHLAHSPFVSCNYWNDEHDTCRAEAKAEWKTDDITCTRVWNLFKHAEPPLGFDPAMIPYWHAPTDENFAILRLEPWHLRVFPGTVLLSAGTVGEVRVWYAA